MSNMGVRTKMDVLRINSLSFHGSIADGPGLRSVIFLQGCIAHCPGCHNPSTWATNEGFLYSIDELFEEIIAKSTTKRITISGGEPLLQKDSLLPFLQKLKDHGFDIVLYTGYDLKDVPIEILRTIDYIKTGLFDIKRKTSTLPYIGSENQKFIDISNLKHAGEK